MQVLEDSESKMGRTVGEQRCLRERVRGQPTDHWQPARAPYGPRAANALGGEERTAASRAPIA